jgi:hypothetical protein
MKNYNYSKESQKKDSIIYKTYKKSHLKNAVIKNIKMKGGVDNDYDWNNNNNLKTIFLTNCKFIITNLTNNQQKFKVLYKNIRNKLQLILFGVEFVIIQNSYYLPYIYYLFNDNIKFKRVNISSSSVTFEDITFEQLLNVKLNGQSFTNLLLNNLSSQLTLPQSNKKNEFFKKLVNKLNQKMITFQENPQHQNPPQMQSPQMSSPQMQSQKKINELSKELESLISKQNTLLGNPFLKNENKENIRKLTSEQKILKEKIQEELSKIEKNPVTQNIQQQIKEKQKKNLNNQIQILTNKEKQLKLFKNKKGIFNINDETDNYICDDASIEVKIKINGNIYFGYNQYLTVKTSDGLYKFYYRYSYHNNDGNFYELKKNVDEKEHSKQLEEKKIDINSISIYDILCLFNAIKNLPNKKELLDKLQSIINKAEKNISKTGEAFFKLENSNFDKEKREISLHNQGNQQKNITNITHKNFGKVKKRQVTGKTYIFFGAKKNNNSTRNSINFFNYVCFREDDKVFYYVKNQLNEKKLLNKFEYIDPLEDLISFILLRRNITRETNFADIIYREAERTIKTLKTVKFVEKIQKKNPNNFLSVSKSKEQPHSLLPTSPIRIAHSF